MALSLSLDSSIVATDPNSIRKGHSCLRPTVHLDLALRPQEEGGQDILEGMEDHLEARYSSHCSKLASPIPG